MSEKSEIQFDEVGNWTEIKLEIISKYATAYSKILSKQEFITHIYIDGFCGAGEHLSKDRLRIISGSPMNALDVEPSFKEFHFIDMDSQKIDYLKTKVGNKDNVNYYQGDCNIILLEEIFPEITFESYKRALCLLDPYGLHLDWDVIEKAGKSRVIELFINFPVADMNRNVFWRNHERVTENNINRMNRFWGDDSWINIAYDEELTLFGKEKVKTDNQHVAEAFKNRLKNIAGFKFVPEPLALKNTKGVEIYYLFFASCYPVADKIIKDIFKKYRDK